MEALLSCAALYRLRYVLNHSNIWAKVRFSKKQVFGLEWLKKKKKKKPRWAKSLL